MQKLLLIDGNNIAYRAYFALPNLETSSNIPTGAVYGFLSVLLNTIKSINPDYIAVCFDSKEKTFRAHDYDEYKAHRPPPPPNLILQMNLLKKEVLHPLGIAFFEKPGFEADDLIATVAREFRENHDTYVIILSSDRDMVQLIKDGEIELISPVTGFSETKRFDEATVFKTYQIEPKQMIDYKAIVGDPSDNIKGVQSVGPKTAQKLLAGFRNVENMLADDSKDTLKIRENKDLVFTNKKLIQLFDHLPVHVEEEKIRFQPFHREDLIAIIRKFEFKSLLRKIEVLPTEEAEVYQVVDLPNQADKAWIQKQTNLYIWINPSGIVELFDGSKIYLFKGNNAPDSLFENNMDPVFLLSILENAAIKIVFNGKNLLHQLNASLEVHWNHVIDLQIIWYLLKPNAKTYEAEDLKSEYARGNDSFSVLMKDIWHNFKEDLEKSNSTSLYDQIEFPLIQILYHMEKEGIKISKPALSLLKSNITTEIEQTRNQIFQLAGSEFNIQSPKQLGFILFDKLNLPSRKKTKTGYSTDADVLEALKPMHPILDFILKYRELTKIDNTYINSLARLADSDDIIHTTFLQAGPATGRISSLNPNLQNLPMDEKWGQSLRDVFITRSASQIFLSADYSQIDLRVMAHFSQDPNLIEAFSKGEDIHNHTAILIFHLEEGQTIEPWMRKVAKTVNFGVIYGMTSHGLSQSLQISEKEAFLFIQTYFQTFKGVKEFIDSTIQDVGTKGYSETIAKRRRPIPELTSQNKMVRELGERLAVNSIIQGSSADIIKIAMIKIQDRLKTWNAHMLIQIHDELVFEILEKDWEEVARIVKQEMETAVKLIVPLQVQISKGKTLGSLQ